MREIADIEMDGHLIDSQMLTRVLDKIMGTCLADPSISENFHQNRLDQKN